MSHPLRPRLRSAGGGLYGRVWRKEDRSRQVAQAVVRTQEDLDAALRRLFLRLQAQALPEVLRRLPEQLERSRPEPAREPA